MGLLSAVSFLNLDRDNRRVVPSRVAPVEIHVMGVGSLDVLNARNVSQTGIGVYVHHGFAGCDLDEEVELVITLPGERSFLARGVIKHQTDGGNEGRHFGVHFTEVTRQHRALIRDYVNARLAD